MNRLHPLLKLLPLLLTLILLAGCQRRIELNGAVLDPPVDPPDFALTDQNGQSFTLAEQKGKVVLLFFGYTHCPDVCPGTLAAWKKAEELLGDQATDARFVFVTVDPERDTPERLAMHVNAFSPTFVGLTGTKEQLQPVYDAFHVSFEKDTTTETAVGYLVSHSAYTVVIDPEGRWRELLPFGVTSEQIAADVEALLK